MSRYLVSLQMFYWTHLLCIPFYTLLILHGADVWKWMVGPLFIFVGEFVWRVRSVCCSDKGRSVITSTTCASHAFESS